MENTTDENSRMQDNGYRIPSINIWDKNVSISQADWRTLINRILNRKCLNGLGSDEMENDSDELERLKQIGIDLEYKIN